MSQIFDGKGNVIHPPSPAEERSWKEDFAHENGSYWCKCRECGQDFLGHKRRIVCRKCATAEGKE